ncbi:Cu2+-exporting ATPase [Rhizoctonia solani]|uniref:Cu2+-exporting ATPase n=1 Tax=Rhizoctonia solani TaxID=456999 RepID=A0A0K6G9F0_9AGAM|nr:Cu2+-exporting ATPase [Rhizoctonia solani]
MNQPRTCGGGCCSPAVDKPVVVLNPPATLTSGECCDASEVQDLRPTTPEPEEVPYPVENLVKACGAPCCGGGKTGSNKAGDDKTGDDERLPPGLSNIPVLPVGGPPVDPSGSTSPGPSSCQATICDDKCGHGQSTVKPDLGDLSTAGRRQLALSIQGMDCPGCSPRVVRALVSFASVAECHVDVFAGRATVTYHPNKAQPEEMARHVVASTGFQCQIEDDQAIGKQMRRMRIQLGRPLDGERPKLEGVYVIEETAGLVQVEYETEINPRDVLASFSAWDGVYVPPSPESSIDSAQREVLRLLYLTVLSAILTLPVLILSWAPLPPHPTAYGAVSLAMTTIIQVVVARPIYVSGIRALLFQYTIDMDLLVSFSVGTAYVFSTVAYACTVAKQPIPGAESYFETAALLVTLIMLGRLIAAYARRRSTNAIAQLGSIQCTEATLVEKTQEGEQERTRVIPIGLVHVGDILRILPGQLVPTDGRLVGGQGLVDESSITGESRPILKQTGTTVVVLMAGTTLVSSDPHIHMRVTVTPDGNTLARMAELMRAAQSARLRVQDTTDRVAGWLAPIALTIALVAFVAWTGVGVRDAYKLVRSERSEGVQRAVVDAIGYMVAIMVVSCPCALALCVPMVAVIAVAVGTRRGVLFKSVQALEGACDVQVVVFDKTGTLTLGKLGIESATYHPHPEIPIANSEQAIQALVRDLTESSSHPVAIAIHGTISGLVSSPEPTFNPSDVRSFPGKGLEIVVNGYIIRGGNVAWTAGDGKPPPASGKHTVFIVSIAPNSTHPTFTRIAYYTLSDSLRPDSLQTIRALTDRGLEVHILSGDTPGMVAQTATSLGIPASQARGGCSPEEKAQWIKFLQTGGTNDQLECGSDECCSSSTPAPAHKHEHDCEHEHGHTGTSSTNRKVMFIGDGTNDALALVQSDISISLGTGTDIASSAANVVLLSSLSVGLNTVFALARASRNRIWINFGWAGVYNVVAILLASGVLRGVRIPPEWAGLGELVSVLPVVLVAWSLGFVRW